MKILLLTQWFDPETCFKGLAFAQALRKRGHHVSVLTGFPNYPGGKIYPGYRIRPWQRELMDGIAVLRVPLYPSHDRSAVRRILNYVSFALSAAAGIFALPRPDIVYVYSPPPTSALGAVILHAVKRVPFVLDVQDMWPDTLGATGMVRARPVVAGIEWWLRLVYRRAARITVLSDGFRRLLIERGVTAEKIEVIRNWTDESAIEGGELVHAPTADDGAFNIVYAGNLGPGQAVEVVLDAGALLKTRAPQVRFLIAGEGVDAAQLRADASARGLDNIQFLGRLPQQDMPGLFARAGALLVHLRDEPVFTVTIPSKTQAYLRAGKPILLGVRGDAAELVRKARAGIAFAPGDGESLADAVLSLAALPEAERIAMGTAGAEYYRRYLSLEVGAKAFADLFKKVLTESRT